MSRALLTVAVLLVAVMCMSCQPSPAPGTPGAKVWFESTESLEVVQTWGSTYPGASSSHRECWSMTRAQLSAGQLRTLESLVLKDPNLVPVGDGWDYVSMKLLDRDGSSATYTSETGPWTTVRLVFDFNVFKDTGTSCQ